MKDKIWCYAVQAIRNHNNKDFYIGPFEDYETAHSWALRETNETLDNCFYKVITMTDPRHI